MRKVILAGVLTALGCAALAVPASASFDRHFTVLEKARFHLLSNEQAFTIEEGSSIDGITTTGSVVTVVVQDPATRGA